jgi:hypothetical protein
MLRWLKRIVFILMALLVVCAAYVATVYFFGSDDARGRLGLVYTAIMANHHPPPIATSGVISSGSDWMMPEPASTKFTAILRRNFPLGSEEQAMKGALVSQGFKLEQIADCGQGSGAVLTQAAKRQCQTREVTQSLRYDWGGVPCDMHLTVRWVASRGGRLTAMDGYYGAECL